MTTFPVPPGRYDPNDESRFRRYLEQELERILTRLGEAPTPTTQVVTNSLETVFSNEVEEVVV